MTADLAHLVEYAIRGIPIGCVFALLAVGLVLTFKTSGVFNLAFAAQAYASAAVFYETRKVHEWPLVPAAIVAILVAAPLIGVFLDRVIYRHQRTAGSLAKLVTSLGLLIAIPEIVKLIFGSESKKNPPPLWTVRRTDDFLWRIYGDKYVLDAGQIATLALTLLVVVGLVVMFRRDGIGLRMRAVVESPRLVELQGIDAGRVSLFSWVLSSVLAGLSGVLIAPLFAQLDSLDFFTLLVAAIAACVMADLSSIWLAVAGGIGLGILQAELAGFLPTNSILANGLRPGLPFVVLFVLVLVRRSSRRAHDIIDPLAGVDPPAPVPAATMRPRWMTFTTRGLATVACIGGVFISIFVLDAVWRGLVIGGVVLAIIFMSIVMTTGVGGTISLCPATFAAIGAFGTAQLVANFGVPVLAATLLGAAIAALVAIVLSFPVLRLAGIYPALATLAFALMFERVMVPLGWVSGGSTPLTVPRPVIGPIDFAADGSFLLLCVALFAIVAVGVIAVREGTTGRFLDALRESRTAAASVGIGPMRSRATSFVLGAGIAGFGGGLLVSQIGRANYDQSFNFYFGLVWIVLVITAGHRSVQAAIIAGLSFKLFPALLDRLFGWPANFLTSHPAVHGWQRSTLEFIDPRWSTGIALILFGLGALTYAKHPEGIIEAQTSASSRGIVAFTERRRSSKTAGRQSTAGTDT